MNIFKNIIVVLCFFTGFFTQIASSEDAIDKSSLITQKVLKDGVLVTKCESLRKYPASQMEMQMSLQMNKTKAMAAAKDKMISIAMEDLASKGVSDTAKLKRTALRLTGVSVQQHIVYETPKTEYCAQFKISDTGLFQAYEHLLKDSGLPIAENKKTINELVAQAKAKW